MACRHRFNLKDPPLRRRRPRSDGGNGSHPDESAAASLRTISARLAELRAYAGYFLAAKLDRIKLTIRQLVLAAVVGAVGLVAVVGLVVTAIVLTLRGIAGVWRKSAAAGFGSVTCSAESWFLRSW